MTQKFSGDSYPCIKARLMFWINGLGFSEQACKDR